MGKTIEQIRIRENQCQTLSNKLASEIWTRPADHHPGPRLLEMPHHEALQKCALDHMPTRSETSCITGGNHKSLTPGTVVILDNLATHRNVEAAQALRQVGCWFLHLPAYSPDLNPIEQAFSKLKAYLRKIGARKFTDLIEALGDILRHVHARRVLELLPRRRVCIRLNPKRFNAESEAVAAWLAGVVAEGIAWSEVALLVRSQDEIPRAKAVGEACLSLTGSSAEPEVRVMHDAKGAEYRAVAVMACDEDVISKEERLLEARDEAMIEEFMATERHLLYVAATRARERL